MSTAARKFAQSLVSVPSSILIFRALQVGDMLCAVPALRGLRTHFPASRIMLAGLPWAAAFSRRFDKYIDEYIEFPGHPALPEQASDAGAFSAFIDSVSRRDIDLALQMHGDGSSSNAIVASFGARQMAGFIPSGTLPHANGGFLHYPDSGHEIRRLLSLTALVGAESQDAAMEFPLLHEDHQDFSRQVFATDLTSSRYVCLHVGARHRHKCWPVDCFAAVADQLSEAFELRVVLTGCAAEKSLAADVAKRMRRPSINAACDMSLGALAVLLAGAQLLICNDTAVSHIAAAFHLPSVVIFVNSDSERWAPLDCERHRCVHDPLGQGQQEVLSQADDLLSKYAESVHAPATVHRPR